METLAVQIVRIGAYGVVAGLLIAGAWVADRARAAAPEPVCKVKTGPAVKVAAVLDGGAFELADGRRVLLSGVDVPRAKGKAAKSPLAEQARAAMTEILNGRAVSLGESGAPSKSGWLRAQVFTADGAWVQGQMVSKGLARVRTFPDRRECANALLASEQSARLAGRGIWRTLEYAVRTPSNAATIEGAFGVVEGRVESVADIGGRVFLNFGPDFRTDFTVHVKPENVSRFAEAGLGLEAMNGKRVRVRGYVRERNGPVIDAAIPEQIELLP